MDEQLRAIADEGVPADLTTWSNDDLRRRRGADETYEAAVSYARRVLQGRLDIVRAEVERRRDAGEDGADDLLARLPDLLAGDHVTTDPTRARATSIDVPPAAVAIVERIDEDLGDAAFTGLSDRSKADVEQLLTDLERLERELSSYRRVLFDRIDAMRDELAARYRDGRADVAELLR